MKNIIVIFILIARLYTAHGQQLHAIDNVPSKEIYDLLVDKKGFLWVAHDFGISRYDGISFTSFTNPEQSAISMTDLIEDNYGRIWCHNFNNQVFYIQNDKLFCLKEYDFKNETVFPRMVLLDDELVITSNQGLFVCNTANLKCRYIINPEMVTLRNKSGALGITSVCVVGKKVLAFTGAVADVNVWFSYEKNGALKPLKAPVFVGGNESFRFLKLERLACADTAFVQDNTKGFLFGVVIRNDSIVPVIKHRINNHINTVSVVGSNVWVNTNKASFLLHGNDTLRDYNLSCVTGNNGGGFWLGSLTVGLLSSNKPSGWTKIALPYLSSRDYICSMLNRNQTFIMCSKRGDVFKIANRPDSFIKINSLPVKRGYPEIIQYATDDIFFIETTKSLYTLKAGDNKIRLIDSVIGSKNIFLKGNIAYLTGSIGWLAIDVRNWGLNSIANPVNISALSDSIFWSLLFHNIRTSRKKGRTRATIFDSSSNCLIVAFNDGLYKDSGNNLQPVLYQGKPLYISSLVSYGKKIYAGSFNSGLFLLENGAVKRVFNDAEIPGDAIIKLKKCNNHIWVLGTHSVSLLDALKDTFAKDLYPLPVAVNDVTDVEEYDNNIYLSTFSGLYTLPLTEKYKQVKINPTLLYTVINGRDSIFGYNLALGSTKNSLLFRFGIPVYEHADRLYFKYRLHSGAGDAYDSTWYYTHETGRDIQFNALKPGSYSLEVIVVQDNEIVSNTPLVINFSIRRPWYNTWPFYVMVALIIISVTVAIQQYRLRQVMKIERVRRKIASDLHDDIGSTLSSINVYSEIAKNEDDNKEYVATIQQNAISIINNLDDLVWNINPKNDVLDNLVARMRQFAEPLLAEKAITCTFSIDADNLQAPVTPDVRTNIYLLFKEAVNNVVKHSGSTSCTISVHQKGKVLTLEVADNGRGFDSKVINKHRNGLHNMQQRAVDIKGHLVVSSIPGTGTTITITGQLS